MLRHAMQCYKILQKAITCYKVVLVLFGITHFHCCCLDCVASETYFCSKVADLVLQHSGVCHRHTGGEAISNMFTQLATYQ